MRRMEHERLDRVRFCGTPALRYAETHPDAVLCHYNTPLEGAREGIALDEAYEIAREDAWLIYCDVPAAELIGAFSRVFGRPARIVAGRADNSEVAIVVDGWTEAVWYNAGRAWEELEEWADGAGVGRGDAKVFGALAQAGAFRGFFV